MAKKKAAKKKATKKASKKKKQRPEYLITKAISFHWWLFLSDYIYYRGDLIEVGVIELSFSVTQHKSSLLDSNLIIRQVWINGRAGFY